jgi:hypothetical protein
MELSAKQAKLALIQHVADGGTLPVIQQHGISAPVQYEVVQRTGCERVWRSEAKAREALLALGFDADRFMEPPRLKSPAQVERIVDRDFIEDLWIHPSRGVDVLPEGSKFERAQFS